MSGACSPAYKRRRLARLSPAASILLGSLYAVSMPGCMERRIIAVRGNNIAALPGAQGGIKPDVPRQRVTSTWESILTADAPPPPGMPIEGEPNRRVLPDGSVHLVSKSPRHLVAHLRDVIQRDEMDLLYEQLLSEHTKEWYRNRGRDPREAIEYIERNATEMRELLMDLPMGEGTPGARFENAGRNAFRLRAPGAAWSDKRFTTIAMRIERRRFVLEGIR